MQEKTARQESGLEGKTRKIQHCRGQHFHPKMNPSCFLTFISYHACGLTGKSSSIIISAFEQAQSE